MHVGEVKLLTYVKSGDERMGGIIRGPAGRHAAFILANHGLVVEGRDISFAVHAAEELEETARLLVLNRGGKSFCSMISHAT